MENRKRNRIIGGIIAALFLFGLFLVIRPALQDEPSSQDGSTSTANPAKNNGNDGRPGKKAKGVLVGGPTLHNIAPTELPGGSGCAVLVSDAERATVIDSVSVSPPGSWELMDCAPSSDVSGVKDVGPCTAGAVIPASGEQSPAGCRIGIRQLGQGPADGELVVSAHQECASGETCPSKQTPIGFRGTDDATLPPTGTTSTSSTETTSPTETEMPIDPGTPGSGETEMPTE